jgi:hypothetical protein
MSQLAQAGELLRLPQERGTVEDAGDELADAGQGLEVGAPVALRVVVQVDQPHELAAAHEGHGERARIAPLAVQFHLQGAETRVVQAIDLQRRVVQQDPLQRRTARGVQDGVPQPRVHAVGGAGDDGSHHSAGDPPHAHAVGAGDGEQALREAPDEALEVVALRHFAGELDEVARAVRPLRQLREGPLGGDGLGAGPRQPVDDEGVAGEVAVARVAQFDGAGEPSAQYDGRPGERPAAAPPEREARPPAERSVAGAEAGDRRRRGVAVDGDPVVRPADGAQGTVMGGSAVQGDGEPESLFVSEVDVAAWCAGDVAQRARRLSRHVPRVRGQQRQHAHPGLQCGAEFLRLPAQLGEVTGLGGTRRTVPVRAQGVDVVGQVAAMAAGAAVGGDAPRVGPAPHRVRADAERVGDVADAEPNRFAVVVHGCQRPLAAPARARWYRPCPSEA